MKWYIEPRKLLDHLASQEYEVPDRSIDDVCDRLLKQSEQNLGHQLDVIYGLIQERDQIKYKTLKALNYERAQSLQLNPPARESRAIHGLWSPAKG